MAELIAGVPMRDPFKGELDYFRKNPSVAGMATKDNKIIINPFTTISEQQKQAVDCGLQARFAFHGPEQPALPAPCRQVAVGVQIVRGIRSGLKHVGQPVLPAV